MSIFWILLLAISASASLILYNPLKAAPRWFRFCFVFSFIGAALGLYLILGASIALQEKHKIEGLLDEITAMMTAPNMTQAKIVAKLDEIAAVVEKAPFALAKLSTLYQELGLYDKAITLLSQAIYLAPGDPGFQIQWVYNHSLKDQGKLTKEVRKVAEELIANDDTLFMLVNLLAIDDYFHARYPQAIQAWQRMLIQDQSLTTAQKTMIEKAMAKATQLTPAKNDLPSQGQLQISIKLDPKFQTLAAPQDVLFIFVKSSQGGAPLAVVKKKASDLPLEIKLDEKHAMMPGQHLKVGMEVMVVAKITKSENALDKKGELRGTSELIVIKSENKPINVTINRYAG
ncbi:MAG: hypothetical protein JSS07_07095 [Proteobacteria bacterium]|nr:hypothetical protein [Pseudomonadota bacterium]